MVMKGENAKYVRVQGEDATESEREIILTGDNAKFVEVNVDGMMYEQATNEPD